ncbi:hypothetical protein V1277_006293 [Bradyrhizobium sp. AZCC 1588]|uniref:hypothetical protein n=1 Tax=unclassified Bradyrhizobium TaxID=2631580 RepID=UPI002FF24EF6
MKAKAIEAPSESPESFAALAAALDPRWHEATQRLANVLMCVSGQLDLVRECKDAGDFVSRCRSLVTTLIDVLDEIDPDSELEEDVREDVGDDEPSLGSFDRMTDQNKAWRTQSMWAFPAVDAEQDNADDEPALGSLDQHDNQEVWATGDRRDIELDHAESGIADQDGLDEQVPFRDWQGVGMV